MTATPLLLLLMLTALVSAVALPASGRSEERELKPKICPYHNGFKRFYYTFKVDIDTSAHCSKEDEEDIGFLLDEVTKSTFAMEPQVKSSHNDVCWHAEFSTSTGPVNLRRFLQGGFIYNGGGMCNYCNPDDDDDGRRRLDSFQGAAIEFEDDDVARYEYQQSWDLFTAYMGSQLQAEFEKELQDEFGEDETHCLQGKIPLVTVEFTQQTHKTYHPECD